VNDDAGTLRLDPGGFRWADGTFFVSMVRAVIFGSPQGKTVRRIEVPSNFLMPTRVPTEYRVARQRVRTQAQIAHGGLGHRPDGRFLFGMMQSACVRTTGSTPNDGSAWSEQPNSSKLIS